MARSDLLGVPRSVELPAGRIAYRERGEGPPVLFVHGLLVNADLWRDVVPVVAGAGYRCLAPDWPLGAHEHPMGPAADLSPPGLAALVADFLGALDLEDATVVGNDTGTAVVQILMAHHPGRVGRVVLTSGDGLERFPPPMFGFLPTAARLPGAAWLLTQLLRPRVLHRLPMTFGWLTRRPVPGPVTDSYLAPARRDAAVRADLRRVLRGMHRRHTLAAAEAFGGFTRPVLLAWAADDRLFPLSLGQRVAGLLPDARLVSVADSYTLVPEDQPAVLGGLVAEFAAATGAAPAAATR